MVGGGGGGGGSISYQAAYNATNHNISKIGQKNCAQIPFLLFFFLLTSTFLKFKGQF